MNQSIPLANAKVSRDAATIRMEQLQIELNHKNTKRAIEPLLPKLLKAIWARGCPSGVVTIEMTSCPIENAIVIITFEHVSIIFRQYTWNWSSQDMFLEVPTKSRAVETCL